MSAAGRTDLIRWIRRELESPGPLPDLGEYLGAAGAEGRMLAELLRAKEEERRAAWYVEAEPLWLRKLTWRLVRPLLLVAVVAAVGFSLQRVIDPTLAVSLFLLGAAALYVTVQFLAHLWARADERRLEAVRRTYRQRLEELLERVERG